ncbi:Methyl-accepting chemotaxis protein III [BD1-7 clade bacterium]|uniref:Methyl-accepting chemotaxis protein III n=1 Tax=BD1-7 clade bacterium TaxID=2029982 RepID=A0A5S9PZN1_9GAMM|nr:Methyl-accepting chemotaxis protein III [BD1-7 clade bacterium]CAA0112608.1 Methyl-accepting chemotaxis protein III [BD1-7 clade bacterium]
MQYVDFFVSRDIERNSQAFYESRMLVVIVYCYLWVMTAFGIFYGLFSSTTAEEKQLILGLTGSLTVGLFACLGLNKATGFSDAIGQFLIGATCVATVAIVYFTGGPLQSPFTVLAFVPAFLSFCLGGLKSGVVWSAVISLSLLAAFLAAMNGHTFPFLAAASSVNESRAFGLMIVLLVIINLVIIYEVMNVFLRSEVDKERDRYKDTANIALEGSIVSQTAESLSASGVSVVESTNMQAEAIEQLSTTAEELGATAQQNSNMAASAMSAINTTNEYLDISADDIAVLTQAMAEVSALSQEIQTINNVINDIAYQTNLLSLNAMIEASRLSEQTGFNVVALEVKKLAERSATSAKNIDDLLNRNQTAVAKGVTISDTIKTRFTDISSQVGSLVQDVQNVSDASHEQSVGITQMQVSLDHIEDAVKKNHQLAEESALLADELRSNSSKMTDMLSSL